MASPKGQHVDISFIIEGAIGIGLAAACGIVGQQRTDILRRFDTDREFAVRLTRMLSKHMAQAMAEQRERSGDEAAFKQLIDQIIAEAGKLVPRG